MSYILYFDLLGTKGFTYEDEYKRNILYFTKAVTRYSKPLKKIGRVGIFSDSVYAYSTDLERLLIFITSLREDLFTKNLFFNAVIGKGTFGITPINENEVLFGTILKEKSTINIYLSQSKYKGIGIRLEPEIVENVKQLESFKVVESIYYNYETKNYERYYDIGYDIKSYGGHDKHLLTEVMKAMTKAYLEYEKYGAYYFSIFATLIRQYKDIDFDITWDEQKKDFLDMPLIFRIIKNIATDKFVECRNWIGKAGLCFMFIDVLLSSGKFNKRQLRNIIGSFIKYPCLIDYINNITQIPEIFFTEEKNRSTFCSYAQDYLMSDLVQKLMI